MNISSFLPGLKVVVKMTSIDHVESRCAYEKPKDIKHFNKTFECWRVGAVRLMKEVLMLSQLDHPGIVRLLGYCARSEEVTSQDMSEHGMIAVYELGQVLNDSVIMSWPLQERLSKSLELME